MKKILIVIMLSMIAVNSYGKEYIDEWDYHQETKQIISNLLESGILVKEDIIGFNVDRPTIIYSKWAVNKDVYRFDVISRLFSKMFDLLKFNKFKGWVSHDQQVTSYWFRDRLSMIVSIKRDRNIYYILIGTFVSD